MITTNTDNRDISQIKSILPVVYCQAIDFFDKLNELYIGQVLVVSRYSDEKKDIINEAWIREGNTVYRRIDNNKNSNMNGDENNVIIREE